MYVVFFVSLVIGWAVATLMTSIPKIVYQLVRHPRVQSYPLRLQIDGVIPALLGGVWGVFLGYVSGLIIASVLYRTIMYAPLITMIGGASGGLIGGGVSGALKLKDDQQ